MNIIVPINIEGLRVSPSTNEQAKTALYDFSLLGTSPISAAGGLIAANQFAEAQTAMNIEPGIHLHWSLPKAYTHGVQNQESGTVNFPVMPNRWLVIRYLKDNRMAPENNTSIRIWVLESDAHSKDQALVGNSKYTIPWMNDRTDIQGLQFNYVGNKIDLKSTWTEPTAGKINFLGTSFQAPFGYGETFTAYYRNSGNIFGLYDDLKDHYPNANQLENNCDFSASYSAMGWLNSSNLDECNKILNIALEKYDNLPLPKPDFSTFIQEAIENALEWNLMDYSVLTPENTGQTQAIMSGILAAVTWKIDSPGNPYYPDALPANGGIDVSVGNNTAEALSAYINAIETNQLSSTEADVSANAEMLLNALQFNQLQKLSSGEVGVGQLAEFLHGTSFAAYDGGRVWSVRLKMDPNQKPREGADNERILPLYLAKILSELNQAQKSLDAAWSNIDSKKKQLFFDWSYYIKSINDHVINGKDDLSSDLSGPFLADGMMHLYPMLLKAGSYMEPHPVSPYQPIPEAFKILAPIANLPTYAFNTENNMVAANFLQQLLKLGIGLDQIGDNELPLAQTQAALAISLLKRYQQGGADAENYLSQASTALNTLLTAIMTINQSITNLQTDLPEKQQAVKQAKATLDSYLDQKTGVFATSLVFKSTQSVPVPAGTTYTGTITAATNKCIGSWDKAVGPFPGLKPQMDIFAGQNGRPKLLFDTEAAAVQLGTAYFYQKSGLVSTCVCAYYLQMAQQELINSASSAINADGGLQVSAAALSSVELSNFKRKLAEMANAIIPGIQALIAVPTADSIKNALLQLSALLNTSPTATSIPALGLALRSQEWQALQNGLDTARQAVGERLPWSQQVAQWNQFLFQEINNDCQLDTAPTDPFYSPNDPVVLFAEQEIGNDLLKPVDRNGKSALLPCRTNGEIVTAPKLPAIPKAISELAAHLLTGIPNLSSTLQNLAIEGLLLNPEFAAVISATELAAAAAGNKSSQYNNIHNIVLNNAPTGLSGKLPYYIGYNWRNGNDAFLPLFIWWETDYQYAQTYKNASETYPKDYLSLFELGEYGVDLEPTETAMPSFSRNLQQPNFFNTHGLISLSSSTTSNLCDQIKIYCTTYLNYDPSVGPPPETLPRYEEALKFYKSYMDYKTRMVLSQGLSGFNESMVQRAQELQIPITIPESWTSISGGGIDMSSLWPSTFLHAQSENWSMNWNAEGINFDAFSNAQDKVFFSPMRAGFMQLKSIVIVDIFGRFIPIEIPEKIITAESMKAKQPAPKDHEIYLAPRLMQPSRLNFDWLSAASSTGIGSFTELNHHPAASPICGWIFPNQLDGTLVLYDAEGIPLGSLGKRGSLLHWFPVPGETTVPGENNRDQMLAYFKLKKPNVVFTDFIAQFLYLDDTAASLARLVKVLSVISKAQQFIITPEMQENADLALLVGRPLVITQTLISVEQKGDPYIGLDLNTYPVWNQPGSKFNLSSAAFIPYDLDNLNQGDISKMTIPVKIGTTEIDVAGTSMPYFDDGLAGYFIADDYSSMYTPVDTTDDHGVISTAGKTDAPVTLTPNGASIKLTMIMDPRAAVHATTGIVPVGALSIPPDQFAQTAGKLDVSFLAAPILTASSPPQIPIPAEAGFQWYWQQIGMNDQGPLKTDQQSTSATFPGTPQQLIDGWLKLKKQP